MNNMYILVEIFTNGYRVEVLDVLSLVAILCGILVIISKNPIVSVLFLIGLFLSISIYLMVLGLNFIGLSYLLVYVGAVSILFLFILMLINVRISELLSNTSNSIPLAIIIIISFTYPVYQILPYGIAAINSYAVKFWSTLNEIWLNNSGYTVNLHNTLNEIGYNNGHYLNKIVNSKINEISLNNDDYIVNLSNTLNGIWYNNSSYSNKLLNLIGVELDKNEIFFATSEIWDGNLSETSHITSIGNIMYTSYSIWLILTSIILLLAMVGAIVITIKQKNSS